MKNNLVFSHFLPQKILQFVLAGILLFGFTACFYVEDPSEPIYETEYSPVYISRQDLNNSVKFENARPLKETGKIFMKGSYVFVGERYEGVHVIDNRNPKSPENVGFIAIAGNVDVSTKGNILYADNAVDLVAIDISNLPAIKVVKRVEEIFSEANQVLPPDGGSFDYDSDKGYIIDWIKNE
ncbi:hypothetical protein WAF17_00440 [Bernardetia sp. ABR2-2B]|uniref:hypothetical protein n=1 Tax=Bernardetia sp. ABR2-2B TaxID=3127472 RepID=UPI0030D06F75